VSFRAATAIPLALAAIGLPVGLCLPAPARAAETASLTAAFSPYRLGRSTTLKLGLKLGVAGVPDGLPPPVTKFDMRLPEKLELVGSSLGLSVCQPAQLQAGGAEACPADARLGFGAAELEVPVGPVQIGESADLAAEMGPPVGEETGVLLFAEASTPVAAGLVFPGVLASGSSQSLSTAVPLIPSLPGAADISLVSMSLSLGPEGLTYFETVHGRTVAYHPEGVALPTKCPRGGFRFATQISFADGTTAVATTMVPCPAVQRRKPA
jgi:hypothetical protein